MYAFSKVCVLTPSARMSLQVCVFMGLPQPEQIRDGESDRDRDLTGILHQRYTVKICKTPSKAMAVSSPIIKSRTDEGKKRIRVNESALGFVARSGLFNLASPFWPRSSPVWLKRKGLLTVHQKTSLRFVFRAQEKSGENGVGFKATPAEKISCPPIFLTCYDPSQTKQKPVITFRSEL